MSEENSAKNEIRKDTVAQQILERMTKIAVMSDEISNRLNDKLLPLMIANREKQPSESEPQEEFPPLWNEMRTQLDKIEGSLELISQVIDRTEL